MTESLVHRTGSWTEQTDAMNVRLPIGDFSRMTYLSIKSLRRYHDMGLLIPAHIDPASGYRYYDASQVPTGQVIRRFRDLGMPLEQVKAVLQAADATARSELIVAHLREMESALAQTQQVISSLRALLERPQQTAISVEYRSAPATRALAITEPVSMDESGDWWAAAFDELRSMLGPGDPGRAGPDGALYSAGFFADDRGDVTAFIPVAGEFRSASRSSLSASRSSLSAGRSSLSAGRASLVEIPAAELAVTLHEGGFAELDQAYGALGTFVAEREIGVQGPIREHYLISSAHTDDESQHRTEVCWPVFRTRGEEQ
jgi:DNA-binding transcriptional MerR regulator/effector-binding domain-containing protein